MLLPPWASQGRGSCCFFFRIGCRSWILLPLSCVFKRWIEFEHWACHDGEVWPLIQILAEASFHWPLSIVKDTTDSCRLIINRNTAFPPQDEAGFHWSASPWPFLSEVFQLFTLLKDGSYLAFCFHEHRPDVCMWPPSLLVRQWSKTQVGVNSPLS